MQIFKRAVVLVLVGAAAAVAVFYHYYPGRKPPEIQRGTLPALISLMPVDCPYVFYADLAALRRSPFLAQLAALAPAPPADREYAEFVRATGLDYSRDLDSVVLAFQPGSPENITVAVAEGRFDHQKISAYALRSGKLERQHGAEVYVLPSNSPAKSVAFTFLAPNRVALVEGASLAPLFAPRTPSTLDPAMRERILRVAGSALFAVGHVKPIPENFSIGGMRSDQFSNLVRTIRWFSLAGRLDGDRLKVAVEGECDSTASALQLLATVEALRFLGRAGLAAPKTRRQLQPQAAALLDHLLRDIDVTREGQRVRLRLEVTSAMLREATQPIPPPNPGVPSARSRVGN